MRGENLTVKEALIRLQVLRKQGKKAQARFRCDHCKSMNTVPPYGEGRSVIECGRCKQVNYLNFYEVVIDEL